MGPGNSWRYSLGCCSSHFVHGCTGRTFYEPNSMLAIGFVPIAFAGRSDDPTIGCDKSPTPLTGNILIDLIL